MTITDTIVKNMNFFPNLNTPITSSGKFNKKFNIPVAKGVIKPKRIAIPLIPLLSIWCGMKNRLKAALMINDPMMMMTT